MIIFNIYDNKIECNSKRNVRFVKCNRNAIQKEENGQE